MGNQGNNVETEDNGVLTVWKRRDETVIHEREVTLTISTPDDKLSSRSVNYKRIIRDEGRKDEFGRNKEGQN